MNRLLPLINLGACLNVNYSTSIAGAVVMALKSVDFEVYGRVQGVFFRKYTKQEADKLDLKGWCRMQGPPEKVEEMKHWLKNTGSPSSRIDKADFKNSKDIKEYTFSNFDIKRDD